MAAGCWDKKEQRKEFENQFYFVVYVSIMFYFCAFNLMDTHLMIMNHAVWKNYCITLGAGKTHCYITCGQCFKIKVRHWECLSGVIWDYIVTLSWQLECLYHLDFNAWRYGFPGITRMALTSVRTTVRSPSGPVIHLHLQLSSVWVEWK